MPRTALPPARPSVLSPSGRRSPLTALPQSRTQPDRLAIRLLAGCVAAVLAGCGGSDGDPAPARSAGASDGTVLPPIGGELIGGATDTDTPPRRPDGVVVRPQASFDVGDPQRYRPLGTGDRWAYRSGAYTAHGDASRLFERVVDVVGGADATISSLWSTFETPATARTLYLRKGGTDLVEISGRDSDALARRQTPALLLTLPVTIGHHHVARSVADIDLGQDLDQDGIPDTVDIEETVDVLGIEAVEVPAGRFDEAIRVRSIERTRHRLSTAASDTPTIAIRQIDDWYAPGIGRVRRMVASGSSEATLGSPVEYALTAFRVDGRPSETVAPVVVDTTDGTPSANGPADPLTARFSEPVDPTTVTAAAFVIETIDGIPVAGAVRAGGATATFEPDNRLAPGRYRRRLTTAIEDLAGNPLATEHVVEFTIVEAAPRLVATLPTRQATGVSRIDPIELTFDVDLDPAGAAFVSLVGPQRDDLEPLAALATVVIDGPTIRLTPVRDLLPGADYEVRLDPALVDRNGNALGAFEPLRFTTETGPFGAATVLTGDGVRAVVATAIGDVTGDGRADLAWLSQASAAMATAPRLHLRSQLADGSLGAEQSIDLASDATCVRTSLRIGDVTGDGLADLVVGPSNCGLEVSIGNADGPLQPIQRWPVGLNTYSPQTRLADLNGDGRLDVIAQAWAGAVAPLEAWYQTATGALDGPWPIGDRSFPVWSFTVGDFNGDGQPDLATNGPQGSDARSPIIVSLLLRDEGGGWPLAWTLATGLDSTGPVVAGDFSGDGRADLIVSPAATETAAPALLRQRAIGGFASTTGPTLAAAFSPALIDVDRDGRADYVAIGEPAGLLVARSRGDAGFAAPVAWPLPVAIPRDGSDRRPDLIAHGDLDGDGLVDLALPAGAAGIVIVPGRR